MNELFRAIPATDLCLDALTGADPELEAAPRVLLRELVTAFWDARREDIRAGHCREAARLSLDAQLPDLLAHVRAGLRLSGWKWPCCWPWAACWAWFWAMA